MVNAPTEADVDFNLTLAAMPFVAGLDILD